MSWEQPKPVKETTLLEQIVSEALEPLPEPYSWRLEHVRLDESEYPASKDENGKKLVHQYVLAIMKPNRLFPAMKHYRTSRYVLSEWKTAERALTFLKPPYIGLIDAIKRVAKPMREELLAEIELAAKLAPTVVTEP